MRLNFMRRLANAERHAFLLAAFFLARCSSKVEESRKTPNARQCSIDIHANPATRQVASELPTHSRTDAVSPRMRNGRERYTREHATRAMARGAFLPIARVVAVRRTQSRRVPRRVMAAAPLDVSISGRYSLRDMGAIKTLPEPRHCIRRHAIAPTRWGVICTPACSNVTVRQR
jgi:hypothetical protein